VKGIAAYWRMFGKRKREMIKTWAVENMDLIGGS
jgi:hypothetical protein